MSKQVIIVGAGIVGSLAALLARQAGAEVTVIDSREPWAASKASAGLFAPKWLSGLSSAEIDRGYDVLRSVVLVGSINFPVVGKAGFTLNRIDVRSTLVDADVEERVTTIGNGFVKTASGDRYTGHVLVAAGMGCEALVPGMPPMRAKWGASLFYPGKHLKTGMINVYAPYRQAIAIDIGDGVWMGDGTALHEASWRKEEAARILQMSKRARDFFKLTGQAQSTVGARPFVEDHKTGYFAHPLPRTWVATGGGKIGTLLAALHAQRFVEEAKL